MGERFKMSSNNAKREAFVSAAIKYNESVVAIDFDSVSKIDLQNIAESAGLKFPHWITRDKNSPLKVEAGELEIDDKMTKGRMKNAFVKSRKNKIGNKAMLSKFCEFVA